MRFDEAYAEMVHVNEFRNSVLYGGKVNSIAEWMLRPEWLIPRDTGPERGETERGSAIIYHNETSGEIDAATCHCHRSNGDAWSVR